MNQWQLSSFVTAHDCCRRMYGNANAVCDKYQFVNTESIHGQVRVSCQPPNLVEEECPAA